MLGNGRLCLGAGMFVNGGKGKEGGVDLSFDPSLFIIIKWVGLGNIFVGPGVYKWWMGLDHGCVFFLD